MKRVKKAGIVLAMVCGGFFWWAFTDPGDKYFEMAKNLDVFVTLYKEINQYYVEDVNPTKLMTTGIHAMLASLDPYTNYYPEEDIEDFRTMSTNEYAGVGLVLGMKKDKPIITMVEEGLSAQQQGLRIGDELLQLDGRSVEDYSLEELDLLIKGQVGSSVQILIRREGQAAPLDFTLSRQKVTKPNVPFAKMVTSNVGIIKLTDFTNRASQEVRQAVLKLKEQGAQGIILDVRGNPGGLLNEAVNISNIFLPQGSEIVSTKGKTEEWNKSYFATQPSLDTDIPLVVLINGRSASASEIVAGAIQDYDRGVLIGQKTFGKGLVQATRPLSYNAQIKITTAKYYIPSGRCIQAIDYADKSVNISEASSEPQTFMTSNGRPVFDGAGIDPDILVEQKEEPSILRALKDDQAFFDFATYHQYRYEYVAEPAQFMITDDIYKEFSAWLDQQGFDYATRIEESLKELENIALEEQYYNAVRSELNQLAKKVMHNKEQDLLTFREVIQEELAGEIISRYYYEQGRMQYQLRSDPEVKLAVEVLNNPERYETLLQPSR
jgi:carboxyl-terminal processing protease